MKNKVFAGLAALALTVGGAFAVGSSAAEAKGKPTVTTTTTSYPPLVYTPLPVTPCKTVDVGPPLGVVVLCKDTVTPPVLPTPTLEN